MPFKPPTPAPEFADLITSLDNSRSQSKDNATWQTIYLLLQRITRLRDFLLEKIGDQGDLSNDFKNVTFLTQDDETVLLPNSRQLLRSLGILFDDTVPGERTIVLSHYWNTLTDGATPPEAISYDGDFIACEVPNDDVAPFFPM